MYQESHGEITVLLQRLQRGDEDAKSQLIARVYRELKRLATYYMRQERRDHTLQPTALVHEAYLKLVGQQGVNWQNRAHFFAVAAQIMRRILVDHARKRLAEKRGGGQTVISLEDVIVFDRERSGEMVALDKALERLEKKDARAHRVVELRFFGGLSVEETAEVLGISARTVKREWRAGRAWLRGELQ